MNKPETLKIFTVLLLFSLILCIPSRADELDQLLQGFETENSNKKQQNSELDHLLKGFDNSQTSNTDRPDNKQPDSSQSQYLEIHGSLSLRSTYNFAHDRPDTGEIDNRGLSQFGLRAELSGELSLNNLKGKFGARTFYDLSYQIHSNRDDYPQDYLDIYEKEFELTETFLQTELTDGLDIKIGRQIVVWGKSDNIRVTDVLNPLDYRQPGLVDIRDLRLPVTMTRLDYYWDNWNLSGLIIHEPRFDKTPVFGSDFFPGATPLPETEKPGWSLDNQQYGLALNGVFSGWDIALYTASIFDQRTHLEATGGTAPVRKHGRISMAGIAANIALGNWLVKAEMAWLDGLQFTNLPGEQKSRFDTLIGVEYSGFSETTISLEMANRHLVDFDPRLEALPDVQKENTVQYALRYTREFLNDTLRFTMLISAYGSSFDGGGFERFELGYDITDNLSITGALIFYESGDHYPLRTMGDNDRFLLELEYRF